MSKTYIVSEELLRQVLDALHQFQKRESMDDLESFGYAADACEESLRTLLAKEPSEPVAWCDAMVQGIPTISYRPNEITDTPLYRKDA